MGFCLANYAQYLVLIERRKAPALFHWNVKLGAVKRGHKVSHARWTSYQAIQSTIQINRSGFLSFI
jgi:hypothetical protein